MSYISIARREIHVKIVYYGPGLCGKTTNVQHIYERAAPANKGKLISLQTDTERTLFFDFLPLDLGSVSGFSTRVLLYTVPGQIFYAATRRLVMQGFDAIVFVADSQIDRLDANIESMEDLETNVRERGVDPASVPLVIQYNKRDLENIVDVAELRAALNPRGAPDIEAMARSGKGVFDTLKLAAGMALRRATAGFAVRG